MRTIFPALLLIVYLACGVLAQDGQEPAAGPLPALVPAIPTLEVFTAAVTPDLLPTPDQAVTVEAVESIPAALTEEPIFDIDLDDNFLFDLPGTSAPGDMVTIDCVVTSENWDPQGVKIVFGQGEQVYLRPVSENPKHWQGQFVYPPLLPENEYEAEFKVRISTSNIVGKKVKYNIQRKLAKISFTGEQLISSDAIAEAILSKPGEYFNPLKAAGDMSRIYGLGYFLDVSYNVSYDPTGNLILQYVLVENPVIDEIEISGNSVFVDYTLEEKMQSRVGQILRNDTLRDDLKRIEEFYQDNQYVLAKVKEVRKPLPDEKVKVLYIEIAEGHIGLIDIKGNKNTKDETILRELEMKPGMVFDRDMLQSDLRRVFNLNYFANVYPDIRPRLKSDLVDVVVNVEEKRTNSINFGGGYGQLDGWFGFVDLFLDNLWGEAKSTLLKAQFGQRQTSYQLRYNDPWIWPDHTSFTGSLWSTSGYSYLSNYIEQRNGWDVEFGRPLSRHVRGTMHFLYEDVFFPSEQETNYKRRGVGFGLHYDTRDYVMNPTSGYYHTFQVDKLLTWFGGTVDSWKYSLSLGQFIPLEKIDLRKDPEAKVRQVLALRWLGNLAEGDVQSSEEYYVGSDNTVRGYNTLFARGRKRWVANAEYRYLFNDIVQGVLFYDAGWAGETSSDFEEESRYYSSRFRTGKGLGVRLITPIGPIRLDWGWAEAATFSEGYLHFSIGHAF